MDAKVVLVTGGTGGIGLQTALELAKRGAIVIVAARNQQRITEAVAYIKSHVPASTVIAQQLDLSSLQSVRECAKQVKSQFQQLHGLVCNAGANRAALQYSVDGIEATFATNHLGHFYLTKLLTPFLAHDARVVVTSSGTHDPANKAPWFHTCWKHPSELAMIKPAEGELVSPAAKSYTMFGAYANSKLCNVLFTYALARRLQQSGSTATAVAYNPGLVPGTDTFKGSSCLLRFFICRVIPAMMLLLRGKRITNTAEKAGCFQARLALEPAFEGITGVCYQQESQAKSSEESYDEVKQEELWNYSELLLQQLGVPTALC